MFESYLQIVEYKFVTKFEIQNLDFKIKRKQKQKKKKKKKIRKRRPHLVLPGPNPRSGPLSCASVPCVHREQVPGCVSLMRGSHYPDCSAALLHCALSLTSWAQASGAPSTCHHETPQQTLFYCAISAGYFPPDFAISELQRINTVLCLSPSYPHHKKLHKPSSRERFCGSAVRSRDILAVVLVHHRPSSEWSPGAVRAYWWS
jgi:hypothetical protein